MRSADHKALLDANPKVDGGGVHDAGGSAAGSGASSMLWPIVFLEELQSAWW